MAQYVPELNNVNKDGVLVCRGCVKLWIFDVLNLRTHPNSPSVYVFLDKNINKVDVCGVVTECKQSGTRTVFRVDDATGSIECRMNYCRHLTIDEKIKKIEKTLGNFKATGANDNLAKALSNVLSAAKKRTPFQGKIKVGDVIQVCGFISDYFDDRTLNTFSVSDPLPQSMEISRLCHMVMLYNKVYDKSGISEKRKPSLLEEECALPPEIMEHFLHDTPMEQDLSWSAPSRTEVKRPDNGETSELSNLPENCETRQSDPV